MAHATISPSAEPRAAQLSASPNRTPLRSTGSTGLGWAPLGLAALGVIPALGGLARLASFAPHGPALPDGERFAAHPIVLAIHVVSALTFSLGGAMQFATELRARRPALHRAIGQAVLPAGIVGALSGLVTMLVYAPAPTAGTPIHVMRVASALAMLGFLGLGLRALLRRDFRAHGVWMTRAYAFGAAPGVQALVLLPLALVAGADTEATFTVGMAIGWIVSLAVAESVVRGAPPALGPTMLAIVHDRYGGPEELHVASVPRPSPGPGEVRVRVEATSLNAADRRMLRADPFLVRLVNGLLRPKKRILGADVAGVIDAIGVGVSGHALGARVMADTSHDGLGGFAEHVCVRAASALAIPDGLDVTSAAALPLAAGTALQAIRERTRLGAGHRVLVSGAGGGVGAYVVQIAKAYGAHVTAVAGARSLERLRALGADRVVDRAHDDLAREERFDVVFGVNGDRPLREHLARLVPGGLYVMIGGGSRQLFEALIFGSLRARLAGRRLEVLTMDASLVAKDLAEIRALVARGALSPVVDRVVPLRDVAEAMRAMEAGEIAGKVVLDARELASR